VRRRVCLVGLLALVLAAPVGAESGEPGWSYDLWNDLMSPYCPGRTLAECPSTQAEKLRLWIVEQEEAGRSAEEVTSELYATFGDVLRQAPLPRGVGLAAYVIPVLLLLGGAAILVLFLRRQGRRRAPEPAPDPVPGDPELERALEAEIETGSG
jgi:cytochrome c-type biogenesis protein CcmH/NrfF